ncbi:MAG: Gfo/Idh/MocA family oxidoreductase [Myxococcota bacterium]
MRRLAERIRFGIVGLGWVGQEVARAALEDPRVTLVGIADSDPAKAGRDLGELIGEGRLGLPIEPTLEGMLARARPEVAVVCTDTDVESVGPILETCIAHGAHVLTTCENLADPEMGGAQLEPDFDVRARAAGLVVLATGVNPGFAMDRLPVMLAQATRNIRRIRVARFVDASSRRAQLQQKVGVGLTPHGFNEAIRNGDVGHIGLAASLRLVARGLGISLDKTAEVFTPVLAASPTTSVLGAVPSGRVLGVHQIARGYRHNREVITLELTIAVDEPKPRDTIDIVGEPPLHFEGELPGDQCAVAAVLSAIAVVVTMPPGLRTVLELPLEQPEEPASSEREPAIRATTRLPRPAELEISDDLEPTTEPSSPIDEIAAPDNIKTSEVELLLPDAPKSEESATKSGKSSEKPAAEDDELSDGDDDPADDEKKRSGKKKRASKKKRSKKKPEAKGQPSED